MSVTLEWLWAFLESKRKWNCRHIWFGFDGMFIWFAVTFGVDNLLLDVTAGMAFTLLLPCLPTYPALDQENLVLEISW